MDGDAETDSFGQSDASASDSQCVFSLFHPELIFNYPYLRIGPPIV